MAEPYYFDEFFVSDSDPGVTYQVPIKGRLVPIVCKRGMSLRDKEEAQSAAIQRHIDTETGRLVIDGIDDIKMDIEILSRTIKSWPFVYRDGSPVPITPETISAFLSEGVDRLIGFIAKGNAAQEAEVTGPFDAASAVASSIQGVEAANGVALEVSPSDLPAMTASTGALTP